jgi:hypothetical protein
MPLTASKTTTGECALPGAGDLKVAQLAALGGVRAGVPLGADAGLPKRGAGRCGRFPNPPGGLSVGVISIRRQF